MEYRTYRTCKTYDFEPQYDRSPGENFREWLHCEGLDSTPLAQYITYGDPQVPADLGEQAKHIDDLTDGTYPVTPEMAAALEKVTSLGVDFWLDLDRRHLRRMARAQYEGRRATKYMLKCIELGV